MIIGRILAWGNVHPKKLFQIDGLGAMLSAVLLGIVLVRLESVFGIPKPTLYLLASLPILFAIYDFYCYFLIDKNIGTYLKGIAIANLTYCGLSMALTIHHRKEITSLGWIYLLTEIALVGVLVFVELSVTKNQSVN
ncbi:MAG: hypothetical protein AAGA66_15935 [Bacteroidota bacterium]